MAIDAVKARPVTIPARDGYSLAGRVFGGDSDRVVVVNAATAVPQRFYRHFAGALAEAGLTAITYDYRGIELESPTELRRLEATARDWAFLPTRINAAVDRRDRVDERAVTPSSVVAGFCVWTANRV